MSLYIIHHKKLNIIDIMPYSTDDKTPIQHDLFERFLLYKEGTGKNIRVMIVNHVMKILHQ